MKILLISLGCDKNLVDSEFVLGQLRDDGYILTDNEEEADVIIVNTCCFIHDAKMESIETIIELAELKKEGNLKALIVCGCLGQRYSDEIIKEIPEVDAVLGTTSYEDISKAINDIFSKENEETDGLYLRDINYLPSQSGRRVFSTGTCYSYLKIAEGCNKHCTYCIIPKLRGDYRSVPMEDLIKQAQYLADCGVKELIIVAQETTLYGTDLYGCNKLPELLNKISEIDGISWIRLLYTYPEDITDELIQTMKDNPKICNYIDMPIQHASDSVLKRMGRRTSNSDLRNLVAKLRKEIPDITLRTTLITGFPGETEEDHEVLKEFVAEMKFDRLGVFTYSKEENTPAAMMENQIDSDTKQTRLSEIMEIQQNIAFDIAEDKIGRIMEVIIEGEIPEDNIYVGRTMGDAPDVDGCVFLPLTGELYSGDVIKARIKEAQGYDLLAVKAL